MDEKLIKERICELINGSFGNYFELPNKQRNELLSMCVSFSDIDWSLDPRLYARIRDYILSGEDSDLKALGTQIKDLLSDFFDVKLDELFYECHGQIDAMRKEAQGLTKTIDNENGEAIWR